MNQRIENQHWISQVLLKRFKIPGNPFQCYQIRTGEWIEKSIERACASLGYNQLLVSGEVDNTLEAALSKVESGLRDTFRALKGATNKPLTDLSPEIHANLCSYCTFLKLISPISKPGAVVSLIIQINMELKRGEYSLLRELKIPEEIISIWRAACDAGRHVVVEWENILQLLYRFQFHYAYKFDYSQFINAKWTISHSPVELPMSDVGLVPMYLIDEKANHYILPIEPRLVLECVFSLDPTKNSSQPVIRGHNLTAEQAEYRFDCICSSAINEIVCSQKLTGIPESLSRAKTKGIRFHKIMNPEAITSAGLTDIGNDSLTYRIVSAEEYKQFIHSYMQPTWRLDDNLKTTCT